MLYDELVKIAILGTERGQQHTVQEGRLGQSLSLLAEQDQQAYLLQAAALVSNYQRAGTLPATNHASWSLAEDDSRHTVQTTRHLTTILRDENYSALLPEWLSLMEQSQLKPTATMIPTLLDLGLRQKSLRSRLAAICGPRGQWLSMNNEDWQRIYSDALPQSADDDASDWETGTLEQRIAYLTRLRKKSSDTVIQRLREVWGQEAAKDRRSLLQVLSIVPQASDLPFLNECLNDKSKEVIRQAALLIVLIPGNSLAAAAQQQLSSWLAYDNKKSKKIHVILPDDWDKTWSQLGIIKTGPRGKGQKAWWLEQFLQLVDPAYWCQAWQVTPQEFIKLLEKHEWRDTLLAGVAAACKHFHNQEWAIALIAIDESLWDILTPEQRESAFQQQYQADNSKQKNASLHSLLQLTHPWSHSFSKFVVAEILAYIKKHRPDQNYYFYHVIRHVVLKSDPETLTQLEKYVYDELSLGSKWEKILNQALDVIRFRINMQQAICKQDS